MTTSDRRPAILVLGHVSTPIIKAGGRPVTFATTNKHAIKAIEHDEIDGLLLTGGGDINPAVYKQPRHKNVYGINDDRDLVDLLALTAALERDIPVMGICRGHQMLNVAFGGTLHQHIGDIKTSYVDHGGGAEHLVKAAQGSRLDQAFEGLPRRVVSIHHQAVARVADGFVATGWANDGIVEAIESVEGWMLGVQFHPEMAHQWRAQQRIFDSFIDAAAKYAGLAKPERVTIAPPAPPKKSKPSKPAASKPATPRSTTVPHFSPVNTTWRCFRCHDMRFDDRRDYADHMFLLHGVHVFDFEDAR